MVLQRKVNIRHVMYPTSLGMHSALTLGSLSTLGILNAAMFDILVVLENLAVRCNLGLLAEKAALVMPDGSDKSRSCRDAMLKLVD
jgi:hypothetical protein